MKALVTGHMGFIGSHLTKTLILAGWQVEGFDLKEGQDIRQREYSLPKADWCFHLAALTDARSEDVRGIMDTNVNGTIHVLEQFRDRVVFASSSAVNYPYTPYAISKLTGEHLCTMAGAYVVRLCNIFGPGGHGVFEKFEQQDVLEVAGLGDQVRTYAHVRDAVDALIGIIDARVGYTKILRGIDMTVNEIVQTRFKDKPYKRVPRAPTDIIDGRQL